MKKGVQPPLVHILTALANISAITRLPKTIVITSGIEGKHSLTSFHYRLAALDIRSRNFPSPYDKSVFATRLRAELGDDYEVLLLNKGTRGEHFHVEEDRKRKR